MPILLLVFFGFWVTFQRSLSGHRNGLLQMSLNKLVFDLSGSVRGIIWGFVGPGGVTALLIREVRDVHMLARMHKYMQTYTHTDAHNSATNKMLLYLFSRDHFEVVSSVHMHLRTLNA